MKRFLSRNGLASPSGRNRLLFTATATVPLELEVAFVSHDLFRPLLYDLEPPQGRVSDLVRGTHFIFQHKRKR